MSRHLQKPILISMAIILSVIFAMYGIAAYDQSTLSYRLTSTIKNHTVHPEIFTESKIIEKYDVMLLNMNGDGEMGSTFQLSSAEVSILLSTKNLIKCGPGEECHVDTINSGLNCNRAEVYGGVVYKLCVDIPKNQVEWSVFWY